MTNKKRLIDANELLRDAEDYGPIRGGLADMYDVKWLVDAQITVDAVEVVHGRWIMDKLEIGNPYDGNSTMVVDIGNCSCCGYRCEMLPVMNYCPNCGAKMDGGADT